LTLGTSARPNRRGNFIFASSAAWLLPKGNTFSNVLPLRHTWHWIGVGRQPKSGLARGPRLQRCHGTEVGCGLPLNLCPCTLERDKS
jgi:hypothetical protein